MKHPLFWSVLILGLLAVGACDPGGCSGVDTSGRQLEVMSRQLDVLHEVIAASRSPGGWALLAMVVSIAVPIVLAVILLHRAERAALHSDEIIRQVARNGLTGEMIDTERLLDAQQAGANTKRLMPAMRRLFGGSGKETQTSEQKEEDVEPEMVRQVQEGGAACGAVSPKNV